MFLHDAGLLGELAHPLERVLQLARFLLGGLQLGVDQLKAGGHRLVDEQERIEGLIRGGLDRTHIRKRPPLGGGAARGGPYDSRKIAKFLSNHGRP